MDKIKACDVKPFDDENFPNPDYPFIEQSTLRGRIGEIDVEL